VVARDGEDRGTAIRKHLVKRFDTFCVFLRNIQLEKHPPDGQSADDAPLPSRRGTELTELTLKCLAYLAREEANRELMASVVTDDVVRAMVGAGTAPPQRPVWLYRWPFPTRLLRSLRP